MINYIQLYIISPIFSCISYDFVELLVISVLLLESFHHFSEKLFTMDFKHVAKLHNTSNILLNILNISIHCKALIMLTFQKYMIIHRNVIFSGKVSLAGNKT